MKIYVGDIDAEDPTLNLAEVCYVKEQRADREQRMKQKNEAKATRMQRLGMYRRRAAAGESLFSKLG